MLFGFRDRQLEGQEVITPEAIGKELADLPDDSGEYTYPMELPDDSGENNPEFQHFEEMSLLPDADEVSETGWVKDEGGSYRDVRRYVEENEHEDKEVHHMPSDWASFLERNDGPCIEMERSDHRQTASCGRSMEAQEYREMQRELISRGDFRGALQMDIDDIHEKFGDKYDVQIQEMLQYVSQLEQEGRI